MRIIEELMREQYRLRREEQKREIADRYAKLALEKSQRRPLNDHDKSLAKSLADKSAGDPNRANIRPRLKEPPKGLKWGGVIKTERDEVHCICGVKIVDHTPTKFPVGAVCPYYWR